MCLFSATGLIPGFWFDMHMCLWHLSDWKQLIAPALFCRQGSQDMGRKQLMSRMFLGMPTLKSSVPGLQVKPWKLYVKITLIWSVNENYSVVTPCNYSNGQFFKLEIHLSLKIHFYEEEVDTSLKQRSMWLTANYLRRFFCVVVTNALIESKTTKQSWWIEETKCH